MHMLHQMPISAVWRIFLSLEESLSLIKEYDFAVKYVNNLIL